VQSACRGFELGLVALVASKIGWVMMHVSPLSCPWQYRIRTIGSPTHPGFRAFSHNGDRSTQLPDGKLGVPVTKRSALRQLTYQIPPISQCSRMLNLRMIRRSLRRRRH
jgi:hypothetical protein